MYWSGTAAEVRHGLGSAVTAGDEANFERIVAAVVLTTAMIVAVIVAVSSPVAVTVAVVPATEDVAAVRGQSTRTTGDTRSIEAEGQVRTAD